MKQKTYSKRFLAFFGFIAATLLVAGAGRIHPGGSTFPAVLEASIDGTKAGPGLWINLKLVNTQPKPVWVMVVPNWRTADTDYKITIEDQSGLAPKLSDKEEHWISLESKSVVVTTQSVILNQWDSLDDKLDLASRFNLASGHNYRVKISRVVWLSGVRSYTISSMPISVIVP